MKKRFISIVLVAMILLSTFSCLFAFLGTPAKAATADQLNIVARANYMYNATWVCKQNVYGWRGNNLFQKGYTYRVPYAQPIATGRYVGYKNLQTIDDSCVTEYQYYASIAGSIFYSQRSNYNGWYSTYYGTDCSAYVSWTWGTDRYTTYSIPLNSTNYGYTTLANVQKLQIGDALNSNSIGHVVLVTGLTYGTNGAITGIEITEQTPPQLKRTNHTPSTLSSNYSAYTIQRYSGTVPAAPDGSTATTPTTATSSTSSGSTSQYYPACGSSYYGFYDAMNSIGVSVNWDLHCRIAAANGITNFSGTAEQNTTLLNLLKQGKLINPDYVAPSTSATQATSSSVEKYYPACDSSYQTLYSGMRSIGVTLTDASLVELAKANGITDYSNTNDQNEYMLNLLKAGKLINPAYVEPSTTATEATEPSSETTPSSAETEPSSEETEPSTDAPEPSSSEITPSSAETQPSSETTPSSAETEPSSKETEPSTDAPEPSSSETTPSSAETQPSSETTPSSAETQPSSETTPSSAETQPSSETTPPSAETQPSSETIPPSAETQPSSETIPSSVTPEPSTDPSESIPIVTDPSESVPVVTDPSTVVTEPSSSIADTTAPATQKPTQPTIVGPGVSADVADKVITEAKNDEDPSGSVFNILQAQAKKIKKNSITVVWKKVNGVKNYIVYSNQCGKGYKKVKTLNKLSFTLKGLKKGTYYKFLIVAVDPDGDVVSTSKTIHVSTEGSKKKANPTGISTAAKKDKVTLKVKKSFKLNAQILKAKKTVVKNHRGIKYETTNSKIALISSKGVITAKKKGSCYVYAYAQNGIAKRIKVTVK